MYSTTLISGFFHSKSRQPKVIQSPCSPSLLKYMHTCMHVTVFLIIHVSVEEHVYSILASIEGIIEREEKQQPEPPPKYMQKAQTTTQNT